MERYPAFNGPPEARPADWPTFNPTRHIRPADAWNGPPELKPGDWDDRVRERQLREHSGRFTY